MNAKWMLRNAVTWSLLGLIAEGGSAQSTDRPGGAPPAVLAGIDVLVRDGFAPLTGCRAGLVTNQTGTDLAGRSTGTILAAAPGVELVAIFSPEHGIAGNRDDSRIEDSRDPATGLPVFSLYGERTRPRADQLAGLDVLVFDIQDIGCRFYTYLSTLEQCLRAAGENGLRMVVLDRPNPINGVDIEGPLLEAGRESFTGCHTIPVRHGMTLGELARMLNEELQIGVDLAVVPVEGWRREDWFDATGRTWINPSPNMRRLAAATVYPGTGLLEFTNVSVGRGTETPFEVVGAPWIEGRELAGALNLAGLPGVRFVAVGFTPSSGPFAGEACGGVNLVVVDRKEFRPVLTGVAIAVALRRLYPKTWQTENLDRLLCHRPAAGQILEGQEAGRIAADWESGLEEFRRRREPFLLYR